MLSLYQKYGRLGSLPTCRKLRLHCDCWLWVYFLSLLRDRECCCSVSKSCLTLCNPLDYSTSGFPVHHHLLEFAQTHVNWIGDSIQSSHPLSSPSPPAFHLSQHQGLFQWVCFLHWWPKYWSFRFTISPSNEYSELISFRMDWLDLLAVQGTLKNLSNTTLQKHQFFSTQLSL